MIETANAHELDVSAVESSDWPDRALSDFTGRREPRFQVVFKQSALDQIRQHGQNNPDIEVCGVLVGNGCCDDRGPYLLVEHCIRGNGADSRSTNVTFTADTWQHIQQTMDREHPDKKIVGWYHTHPGFGIFLSDMDMFICEHFFNLPWQVAFVYDPHSDDEGNFIWRTGRPQKDAILIEQDAPVVAEPVEAPAKIAAGQPSESDLLIEELLYRIARLERRLKLMVVAMAFFAAFVVMWSMDFGTVPVNVNKPATQPAAQLPAAAQNEAH